MPRNLVRCLGILLAVACLAGCSQPDPRPDRSGPEATEPQGESAGDGVDVHILGFNDFHGHLEGPAGTVPVDGSSVEAGGVARLARVVDDFRSSHESTATVVSGDLIGASPLVSALFHDEPTIEIMNEIGLDGVAVGNHEFDEGWRELRRIADGGCHPEDGCYGDQEYAGAEFPFLAANIYGPDGERLFDPWVVRTFEGERVAFVGLVLDGIPSIVLPSAVEGLTFENEVRSLESVVPKLRSRGIETIVALIHEGGYPKSESWTGTSSCPGLKGPIVEIVERAPDAVDAYLTGHTHQTYICRIDDRLVTSAMSKGRLVTEMSLTIDRESGDVAESSARNRIVRWEGPKDATIQSMVDRYKERAAEEAEEPVGRISETLPRQQDRSGESPLGKVIADAQLAATQSEETGRADFALMNPGGIRAPLEHAPSGDERPGIVTYGELHRVQPFRNQLVVLTLTGEQIHDVLEHQWRDSEHATVLQISEGLSYTWHADREVGNRVRPGEIRVGGRSLEMEKTYRVTVNNFLAQGGDGFETLKGGTDRTYGPIDIQALRAYFEEHSPISPPGDDRIRRVESSTSSQ